MTTIAWDGITFVSDSQATLGQDICSNKEKKIFTNVGIFAAVAMVGVKGQAEHHMLSVISKISDPRELWGAVEEEDMFVLMGIVKETGVCWTLDGQATHESPVPWAWGSGAPYALAAMDLGRSASEAVKYASTRDPGTNNRIQTYKPKGKVIKV